jgi:phage terminase large subunit-like protein
VISADGDLQDGVGPSLAIFDELHRWHTDKAKTLWDVLTKGTIAREQPLVVEITTAGTQHSSPICYQEHEYARRVLSGQIKSERFFGFITSADPVKIKEDPHYWRSREARVAANPSHEDNGGFLKDARLASIMEEAIEKPHERNAYFRYHLNIWTSAQNRYLPMDSWHNCGAPTRALSGRRCIAGLDLSHTTDLTALTLLFPDRDDTFDVYPLFFMPSGRVAERERQDKQPYSAWAQMGYLTLTEGETIKYSEIVEKIQWAYKEFRLEMLIADPKDMASIQQRCDELGIPHMEQPQGYHLSPAMKELLSLILQGRIRHGNNPILTWNADCLSAKTNDNGDVKPIKPNRSSENVRIDGVIALLDALNYTLRIPQSPSTLATFV